MVIFFNFLFFFTGIYFRGSNETAAECKPSSSRYDHVNNIHMIRKEVKERIVNNAEKMLNRYKQKRKSVITFQVGDLVSVHVPKIDRGPTDTLHVPCRIVKDKK